MARPVFRPIIFALKRAPTWPGLAMAPEWGKPAPVGYEYVYDRNGILKYANDNSPYITDGIETISVYEYEARLQPLPAPGLDYVSYQGLMVSYGGALVTYPTGGYNG